MDVWRTQVHDSQKFVKISPRKNWGTCVWHNLWKYVYIALTQAQQKLNGKTDLWNGKRFTGGSLIFPIIKGSK